MQAGPPRLTQFQNVMPWVMVAPLGWPVVPDVYMMVETSSSVTSSARSSGFADAMPPHRRRRGRAAGWSRRCRALRRERRLGEIGVVDHHLRRAIAGDELKLGNGEAGVQRHEDGAEPSAGELHLQRIGRVQRQHRDAVAARDLERVAEKRGEARDAGIELRIGEAALAREVDDRDLVRRAAA